MGVQHQQTGCMPSVEGRAVLLPLHGHRWVLCSRRLRLHSWRWLSARCIYTNRCVRVWEGGAEWMWV